MRMNYKIRFDSFNKYMELKNITASKKTLLKDKNARLFNFMNNFCLMIGSFIIFYALTFLKLNFYFLLIIDALMITNLVFILIYLFILLVYLFHYFKNKNGRSGCITFDEDGLIDSSDMGYICGFKWDNIDLVVVTNDFIVIFSSFFFCLYFEKRYASDLLENIRKNKKDVLVIDKSR